MQISVLDNTPSREPHPRDTTTLGHLRTTRWVKSPTEPPGEPLNDSRGHKNIADSKSWKHATTSEQTSLEETVTARKGHTLRLMQSDMARQCVLVSRISSHQLTSKPTAIHAMHARPRNVHVQPETDENALHNHQCTGGMTKDLSLDPHELRPPQQKRRHLLIKRFLHKRDRMD